MKNLAKSRIFIVDDDPFWSQTLKQILGTLGYKEVFTFDNGENCLKEIHLNPELIFLDYKMDGMDGLEVLEKVKEYFPGIAVIFCTAYEDLSIAVKALENGSYDYLLKGNTTREDVLRVIENVTVLHQQQD
jgi:DNA-binding NtrC family response regulator